MATTYYANGYYNPAYSCSLAGVQICREFKFNVTVVNVINDLIKLAVIPAGVMLDEFFLDVPDLDASTGIVLQLGDDTTPTKYVATSTVGQAGGRMDLDDAPAGALPAKYTAANNLVLKVATGPTGALPAPVSITGWFKYHYFGATEF
jgi:hypothetical protein